MTMKSLLGTVSLALLLGGGHSSVALAPAAPRIVFTPMTAQSTPAAPVDRLAWLAAMNSRWRTICGRVRRLSCRERCDGARSAKPWCAG